MVGEAIRDKNFFKCSNCQNIRSIEKLKGSFENQGELENLIGERKKYITTLADLDELEASAEFQGQDTTKIKQTQKNYEGLLLGISTRIKNWSGLLICVFCWDKGDKNALSKKGDNVVFTCKICERTIEGKVRWCHVVNFQDRGINPDVAVKLCKNCWLNDVVPNDKIEYCPRDGGEGYQGFEVRAKFDCQCPTERKNDRERAR